MQNTRTILGSGVPILQNLAKEQHISMFSKNSGKNDAHRYQVETYPCKISQNNTTISYLYENDKMRLLQFKFRNIDCSTIIFSSLSRLQMGILFYENLHG